jgi:hypothetical protein
MSTSPSASNSNKAFTVTPSSSWSSVTTYKIKITKSIKGKEGDLMTSDYVLSNGFKTGSGSGSLKEYPSTIWAHSVEILSGKIYVLEGILVVVVSK